MRRTLTLAALATAGLLRLDAVSKERNSRKHPPLLFGGRPCHCRCALRLGRLQTGGSPWHGTCSACLVARQSDMLVFGLRMVLCLRRFRHPIVRVHAVAS